MSWGVATTPGATEHANMKAVAKKGSFEADLAMFSLFHSPRSEIKAESHDFYRVRSFIIITIQTDLDFSISSLLV